MVRMILQKPVVNKQKIDRLSKKLEKKGQVKIGLCIPGDIFYKFKAKSCYEKKFMTEILVDLIKQYVKK